MTNKIGITILLAVLVLGTGGVYYRTLDKGVVPIDTGGGISESGVRGTVMLGPTCPVMREPPDPQCADKPFKTNLVLTTTDGARIVKYFSSDAQGAFSVPVSPGVYLIRSAPGGPVMPSCSKSEAIEVKANSYTVTTISCDTGIR